MNAKLVGLRLQMLHRDLNTKTVNTDGHGHQRGIMQYWTRCSVPIIIIIQGRLREQPAPATAYTASLELFCVMF